jgi:hypothetical protein
MTCAQIGQSCGAADDGCGRALWCGSCDSDAGGPTGSTGLSVIPGEAYLTPGAALQLRAVVQDGGEADVRWSISEGAEGGEVDASGRYQAPERAGTFHLVATDSSDPSSIATATVHTDSLLVDGHGPLLASPTVHAIWWGPASAFGSAPDELVSFFTGLEGSAYLETLDQYLRGGRASVRFAGNWFDPSMPPQTEDVAPMQNELCAQLDAHRAAPDPQGIYFLFYSSAPPGPAAGFHWRATCHGVSITFAWVQNVIPGVEAACGRDAQTRFFAHVAAHELFEAMSDPEPYSGWNDPDVEEGELSDKCELLSPQRCVTLSNGSSWALPLQWSNSARDCVLEGGG